ncbi:DUF928 domain-containing protein [Dapis sp. BLCC M126]|uniref:DUF928 domain-containing protein n=1 Tax=Dapis sp. BLCC M126 TaxID=3400189 RepID=UPI003CEACC0E
MKIKQFAAVIISICGLNVGIAKSVAVEMKAPVLAQQSGKIEEFDGLFQQATVSQELPKYNQSTPILESKFAISQTSDTREKAGVREPDKVVNKDRGGNPDSGGSPGGGTRSPSGKCNGNDQKPFLVLIPDELVETLASHPTFWLYIPRSSSIKFELFDKHQNFLYKGDKPIYETKLNVQSEQGFISWKLPSSAPPLDDNFYSWKFSFDCGDNSQVILQGSISRIAETDSLITKLESAETVIDRIDVYQENDLWPESVNELVNLRRSNPDDPEINDRFKILLGKWYNDIVNDPIQDCCEIGQKE